MKVRPFFRSGTRWVVVAAWLVVLSAATAAARKASAQPVCDVNGSGSVTSSDALIVLKAAAGDPTAEELCGSTGTTTTTLLPSLHTLSVTRQGDGMGTVTSNPGGIHCGADCSEQYDEGIKVTLTATGASGSKFTGWSGNVPAGCNGSAAPCTVTMSRDRSVTATFAKDAVETCPTNGPLTDLRVDCTDYGYFFMMGGIVAGMTSDGDTIVIVQSDGIDALTYLGPVTGQRTFELTDIGTDELDPLPLLDPGSKGGLSADGELLSWTAILRGESYVFSNYAWFDTQPLLSAEVQVRSLARSLDIGARGVLEHVDVFTALRETLGDAE